MSSSRDFDRLIGTFLEEGPTVLPNVSLDIVRDEISHSRQRAVFGPWRSMTIHRLLYAASTVVAVVAIAVAVILATRATSDSRQVGASPTPLASSRPTDDPPPQGSLTIGQRYHAAAFGEPLRFVLPNLGGDGQAVVDRVAATSFSIRGAGVIAIYDDARDVLPLQLCDAATPIEIPPTPEAVGEWLKGQTDLSISVARTLVADGGSALSWDVVCTIQAPPPLDRLIQFQKGDPHRIYAVPTGDDTILIITTKGGGDFDAFNRATDQLVQSMTFD